MKATDVALTLTTPAANNIGLSQTPGAAGNLTLDGALISGGVLTLTTAHAISITSAANLSGRTFTVTGTDADGNAQVEVVTGPNATTVYSADYWKTISSIAVDAATGAALTVGVADRALSATIQMAHRYFISPVVGLQLDASGTISATVQHTMQELGATAAFSKSWIDHDTLAAVTADATSNYAVPVSGIRLKVNSYTAGATLKLSYVQI